MSTPAENEAPAPSGPSLRQTDFLPARFSGKEINDDECLAHFLAFQDYIEAHNVTTDAENLSTVINIFKRTLTGSARLWIEGKTFTNVPDLKEKFLARFSKNKSYISHVQAFNNITYIKNDSADQHLSKIERAALKLGYGNTQIRDKFLTSLPQECRSAILMSLPSDAPTKDIVTKAQCFFDLNINNATAPNKVHEVTFNVTDTDSNGDHIKSLVSDMESLRMSVEGLQASLKSNTDKNADRQSRSPSRRSSPRPNSSRYRSPSNPRNDRSSSRSRKSAQFSRPRNDRSSSRSRRDSKHRPTVVCFYCNKPGHIQRNCFLRRSHFEQSINFGNSYQQFPQQNFRPLSSFNANPPPPNHSNNFNYPQNF